jgi:DNA-binding NtrC family response regulator
MKALVDCPWKGNVRELRVFIESLLLMHDWEESKSIGLADVGKLLHGTVYDNPGTGVTLKEARAAAEVEAIALALNLSEGDHREAAKILGISPSYLSRLIGKHALGDRGIIG